MKKLILIFALIPLMAVAQYGQRGASGGSTFYWSLTGQAQKTDSLRIIQGSNMTITQSGNTVTFNGAAGAGSTANVRANTGWTSNGTTAQDTLATYYDINGKFQRLRIADTDGDSLILAPHALFPFAGKDGTLLLFAFDSTGRMGLNAATAAQATRAFMNVLTRATADTIAIWSNEGNTSATGDSVVYILPNGAMSIASTTAYSGLGPDVRLNVGGDIRMAGNALIITGANAQIQLNSSAQRVYYDATNKMQFFVNGVAAHVMDDNGYVGINNAGLKSRNQGVLTVRGNGTADSTLVVRNDKESTLDSTFAVFANGRVLRRDTKALPAGAWLATAANGAALSSSNYMVTYAFDSATAETLTVDFALPPNFIQISNVEIEVIAPNTDGDSVGFAIAWLGRAADEAFNVAFSSPLSGQIDLGTTANVRKILTISGTFDNLAASDRLIFKLWRDPSIDNDVAADVHLVDVRVNGNGLLY